MVCDLSKTPWPWDTHSADEVMMLDFLEHFPRNRTHEMLCESHRVLRKGGLLRVQVPDMKILSEAIVGIPSVQCNECGSRFESGLHCASGCGQTRKDLVDAAFGRMYGGQDYEGNFHMAGFTKESLSDTLMHCGFIGMRFEEADHQAANWNFCVVARSF
jgi:hypothetical protein